MKKKSKKKEVKKEIRRKKGVPDAEPSEKPFDFGGLPDRNLKKNLGCG